MIGQTLGEYDVAHIGISLLIDYFSPRKNFHLNKRRGICPFAISH